MKTSIKILLVIIVILVGVRIYLPYWVTDYVNKVLDEVPEYSGSIEGVSLNLYRGAYKIHQLKMEKDGEDLPVPFLDIKTIDLSVEWNALLNGRLVGEVDLHRPEVNFIVTASDTTTGGEADWTKPIKELMPLQINRFAIINGKIAYRDFSSKPQVNIALDSLQLVATNLSNAARKEEELPSTIKATATSIGGGSLTLTAKANLLKQIPDFDMTANFETVSLPALNDFTKAYAKLDFEKGIFNVYSEIAVVDGMLTGYVKPVITEIKIVDFSEDKDDPLKMVWESIAGTIMELFENQPKDQFATKVPFEGDLNNVKGGTWPTIGNIFKNAFLQAFEKETDSSVSFEDIKKASE
ncbi:MAG: DUF748 domain-containing protein [Fulvivirga sp.]